MRLDDEKAQPIFVNTSFAAVRLRAPARVICNLNGDDVIGFGARQNLSRVPRAPDETGFGQGRIIDRIYIRANLLDIDRASC